MTESFTMSASGGVFLREKSDLAGQTVVAPNVLMVIPDLLEYRSFVDTLPQGTGDVVPAPDCLLLDRDLK